MMKEDNSKLAWEHKGMGLIFHKQITIDQDPNP